ncbi:MAG: tolA [Gammaproteobacteria bacterium]|jgi:colicin import membrane protein|nr:tolA [Gammaproteobacteria bacterium]
MRAHFSQSFGYSLFFHILIALVFFVSLSDSLIIIPPASNAEEIQNNKEIVNAVAISQDDLSKEIRNQQAAENAAKAKVANEARQLAAAKAQALAQIQQAKQEQMALAAKQQADAKKAADQLAQLQAQQKQAAEQLAQTQAQAAATAKKAAEAQQQVLAAQKAAEAKRQAQQQQALAAQQAAVAAANTTQMQNEINRYVGLITQSIQAQWTQLPGAGQQKLATTMLIHLAADGTVLQVQNVGSSGNPALDRLALTAVYKASPLPVPTDPTLFANFRELKVKFNDT